MPKKYCTAPGCNELIDIKSRWCTKHRAVSNKDYDKLRANDPLKKFMNSARWQRIRKLKMQMNPICENCTLTEAQMVDHCKERRDGGCNDCMENLVSLCNMCHNKKTKTAAIARVNGTLEEYYKTNCNNSITALTLAG